MFWVVTLGIVTGMRTMTAITMVCWGAYLGLLPVQGTWAEWTAHLASPLVFTVLALGEYIGDTLPQTPNRTDLPLVGARLGFGVLVGLIVAAVLHQPKAGGVIFGALGALIGTYYGFRVRTYFARKVGHDAPVGLAESAIALTVACWAVKQIYWGIRIFGDNAMLHWPVR